MSLRISVITAVFNRAPTIEQTIESVYGQTWPTVEHVVIDGGSTDGTLDILRANRSRLAALVSEPDSGIYDALNKGVRRSTGDVVGFLHADDMFADLDTLSAIGHAFSDPAVNAVYGDLVYVNADNSRVIRYWRSGEFSPERLAHGWMPPHPTFYVRRSIYEQFGLFDTSFRIAADYDHMLRVLAGGASKVTYIPKVLVRMRWGGASNQSVRNIVVKSSEDYAAIRRNGIGGLGSLVRKNLAKIPQFLIRAPGSGR